MSVTASCKIIPPPEYRKFRSDPMHYVFPPALADFDLFKDWPVLDSALKTMPYPQSLALRGNRPESEDDEGYFGFATPGLVKKIEKALRAISDDDLISSIKAVLRQHHGSLSRSEKKSFLSAFHTLRAAYQEAAKQRAYLSIMIG